MISAETTSCGTFSPRPCWVNRDMNSWQIKLGSFRENWNAASLALSIKGAEGLSEGVGRESAGPDSAGGGSGQGGGAGCPLRLKVGTLEQGGVLCSGDWALAGVVANASATAPARRSQRTICRRLHRFTDSPSLESSTICQAARSAGAPLGGVRQQKQVQADPPRFTTLEPPWLAGWLLRYRIAWRTRRSIAASRTSWPRHQRCGRGEFR